MNNNTISFSISGDSLAVKRMSRGNEALLALRDVLLTTDVRFTNLETSLHRFEPDVYPSRFSGGDWVVAPPEVLDDLNWFGMNLYAAPNNHSLDWSHNGLVRTIENLERAGVSFAGIGRNWAAAAAPAYLETPNGRVALIAVNATFEAWHKAGEQRRDMIGRPGIHAIAHKRVTRISREHMQAIQAIHQSIPHPEDEGAQPDGSYLFRGEHYDVGDPGIYTQADEADLICLRQRIHEANRQADLVVVSMHSHESSADDPEIPADFQKALAHFCIDHGAHAYLGHGPHVLRGIERYKGRPIFHSMGNFFYQCESLARAPEEFYHKFSEFGPCATTADVYDFRVNNGSSLGDCNPLYFQSALSQFDMVDGQLASLSVIPIDMHFAGPRSIKGTPAIAQGDKAQEILARLQALSAPFGTSFELCDGRAKILL